MSGGVRGGAGDDPTYSIVRWEVCTIKSPRGTRSPRTPLIEISGQSGIPTLVCEDGTVIADDDEAIVSYLEKNYAG